MLRGKNVTFSTAANLLNCADNYVTVHLPWTYVYEQLVVSDARLKPCHSNNTAVIATSSSSSSSSSYTICSFSLCFCLAVTQ